MNSSNHQFWWITAIRQYLRGKRRCDQEHRGKHGHHRFWYQVPRCASPSSPCAQAEGMGIDISLRALQDSWVSGALVVGNDTAWKAHHFLESNVIQKIHFSRKLHFVFMFFYSTFQKMFFLENFEFSWIFLKSGFSQVFAILQKCSFTGVCNFGEFVRECRRIGKRIEKV